MTVRSRPSTPSLLATPTRIAVAGDWHVDTDYAVAAVNLPQLGSHRLAGRAETAAERSA